MLKSLSQIHSPFWKDSFLRFYIAFLTLGIVISCQSTDKFQRSSPVNPGEDAFLSTCLANQRSSSGVFSSHGFGDTRLKVQGQFCNLGLERKIAQPVHIVHIVDYSGSMREVDPLVQGSCSRLQAAQAFTEKFRPRDVALQDAPIFVSLVGFGSYADIRFTKVPLAQLNATTHVNASNFCKIELGDRAGTNYEYAFKEAHKILAQDSADTKQEILFVSDGLPTVFGDSPSNVSIRTTQPVAHYTTAKNNGIQAAHALRNASTQTKLYIGVLEIKDDTNGAIWNQVIPDVKAFFVELAGGHADRVKMVERSADLAKEIDVIQIEHGLSNDQGALRAILSAPGFSPRELQARILHHNTQTQTYTYEVEWVPFSHKGQTVENQIQVYARSQSGEDLISTSLVRFESR